VKRIHAFALCLSLMPLPALAFDVMDPAAITPILEVTRANWVALRAWEGAELLYFTHIEAWRCAVNSVSYSINGAAPVQWQLAPCQVGTPTPNALPDTHLPFIRLPSGELQEVLVVIEMKDGKTMDARFERGAIFMP
jgi:hypothetical protein